MTPIIRPAQPISVSAPVTQVRGKRWAWLAAGMVVVVMLALHFGLHHASFSDNAIHSGLSGACLDVFHNGKADGTPIDAAPCNGSQAQAWTTTATAIHHVGDNECLGAASGGVVALQPCSSDPSQVWLRDNQGYFNPDSGQCLSVAKTVSQAQLANCNMLKSAVEQWSPASAAQAPPCSGDEGEAVACNTVKQWTAWQQDGSDHEALLTAYTDGTPYEEWCADFVSYIYKLAGHPFTNGSADGWDQNNSNDVQYMGFTLHEADSGYVPKSGDVAFFNYPGGHVEIVASGGKRPTFIYGDSAQIDPSTGNGQMKANTILEDGEEGSVVYYLSPARA